MTRPGITRKLILIIRGFTAVFLLSFAIVYNLLRSLQDDLRNVVNSAQPLSSAAYEMEINALGAGFSVVKYLNQPDQQFVIRFEDDIGDFWRYHNIYLKLSSDEAYRKLATDIAASYAQYIALGREVMARRDMLSGNLAGLIVESRQFEELITQANELGENSDPILRTTFSELRTEMSEVLVHLNVFSTERTVKNLQEIEAEITHITQLLSTYRDRDLSSKARQWADQLSAYFDRVTILIRELSAISAGINTAMQEFTVLRERLDVMLDDEIQKLAEANLDNANEHAQETASLGLILLVGAGAGAGLLIFAVYYLVSRNILAPVRQLSLAADELRGGQLTRRVNIAQDDELGNLGDTFNQMAESLEQAHHALIKSNVELDSKVIERTLALAAANSQLGAELTLRKHTEDELRLAIAASDAANKAKSMFLANMSHELRTPLNAIIGFSDVIKSEMFGPVGMQKYADYAKDINSSGQHLLGLINELLDISRIEAGKLELDNAEMDLHVAIGDCVRLVSNQAKAKQIMLSSNITAGELQMLGDITRIRQIFINLLNNGIKFTPENGKISIIGGKSSDGGISISVSDTGIGISPAHLPKVLEAFGQVRNSMVRAHEGAGLGLPLAKMLVEQHDGQLSIGSELGKGTTITVTFPAARVIAPAQRNNAANLKIVG